MIASWGSAASGRYSPREFFEGRALMRIEQALVPIRSRTIMGVQASDGFLEAGNSLSEMWLCAWSTTGVLKDIDHGSAGFSGFWQYEGCGAWTASVTNHGHDDEFVPTQRLSLIHISEPTRPY